MQSATLREARNASRLNTFLTSRWMLYLLIALTIPARLLWIHFSLWLDEAWVANAVLAPSLKEMIYYPHWVQSTPVLFMLLERFAAALFGTGEIALRLLPWFASLAAAFIFSEALRMLFPLPLTTIFVALFSANYWGIKYGEQLKQYATDLFVSATLVWLITLLLTTNANRRRWRAAVIVSFVLCFLSFPVVFWLPGIAVALGLSKIHADRIRPALLLRPDFLKSAGLVLSLLAVTVGIDYLLFIAPNHPDIVATDWDKAYHAYLGSASLLITIPEFFRTLANLLIPRVSSLGFVPWVVVSLVLLAGAARSIRNALKTDKTGIVVFLAGVLPVAAAIVASCLRKYPLLDYPRLVLWMLPSLLLLLACALEPIVSWFIRMFSERNVRMIPAMAFAASAFFVLGTSALLARQRVPFEGNRALFATIAKSWRSGDAIFLHGGLVEQFDYYRHRMNWNPTPVYVGNTDWPCCALEQKQRSSTPSVTTLSEDLTTAVRNLRPNTLWVVLPGGQPDAWSGRLAPELKTVPASLAAAGCPVSQIREFGQVQLETGACDPARVAGIK